MTKHGGKWLGVMDLPIHDPKGAVVLYHVHNEGHEPTLIEEIRGILKRACEIETEEAMDAEGLGYRWAHMAIHRFTLALKVPNIPGQDTKKLDKVPWKLGLGLLTLRKQKRTHVMGGRRETVQEGGKGVSLSRLRGKTQRRGERIRRAHHHHCVRSDGRLPAVHLAGKQQLR